MPTPRNQQISVLDTSYYHCISRCVRRSFLCGDDALSGKNYNHRKQWIIQRLALLANTFAIDICGFAVMSNHCHTVLSINTERGAQWSEEDVMQRWQRLFSPHVLVERYQSGQCTTSAEKETAQETIALYRSRLMDISWFMRCLNEHIARKANKEDHCTGHFWEGRFKSQALLNEQALMACLSYVDLNPVRASLCDSLDTSEHTSIKQRIEQDISPHTKQPDVIVPLLPFVSSSATQPGLPFSLTDYLALTDWTGRCIRQDKKGAIPATTPPILVKLGLDCDTWLETVNGFSSSFHSFVGAEEQLQTVCQRYAKKWVQGIRLCRQLFHNKHVCPT